MRLYAASSARRSRQLLGDALVFVWVLAWMLVGRTVRDVTLGLAVPGETLADAGTGLAGRLRDAGAAIDDVPLVGDEVRAPFDGAGDAAAQVAQAGEAQAAAVADLAFWLGLSVALIPILLLLAVYVPLRARFVRRATAGQRLLDSGASDEERLDLFALRALARQPLHRLVRAAPDPAEAWRQRDPEAIRRLAELELTDAGLR